MMRIFSCVVLTFFVFFKAFAAEITVYNAADLVYAMEEIQKLYESKYPNDKVKMIFGSSGKGYHQIVNGAPYDVVLSADMMYVQRLKDEHKLVISEIKPYAIGRIVLWVRKDSKLNLSKGINVILDSSIKKIAVTNWEHAPYGVAAKECMEYYKVFDKVKNKFVLGENLPQTAHFVQTGAADIGFLALSLSLAKKLQEEGRYVLLPDSCHTELLQGYAILKHAEKSKERLDTAKRFFDFISSKEARNIFVKYGFVLPGEM